MATACLLQYNLTGSGLGGGKYPWWGLYLQLTEVNKKQTPGESFNLQPLNMHDEPMNMHDGLQNVMNACHQPKHPALHNATYAWLSDF